MNKEGIVKHKEVFDAWIGGAEVEVYEGGRWHTVADPEFRVDFKYRIKPVPKMLYRLEDGYRSFVTPEKDCADAWVRKGYSVVTYKEVMEDE